MSKGFVWRLAISNIKKNRKFYLPYVIASVGIIMMFYIMLFLSFNKGIDDMAGAESLRIVMALGSIVLGLFSLIFIFYINSFLMKRRQKEIGLYNILGMEKRHIAKILLFENFITSVFSIMVGILCGILFSKLIFMLLCETMKYATPIGFTISTKGMAVTAVVFGIIFFLTLLKNQMSIGLSKPIELLKGSNVGEREPRSKSILAIIGGICLGAGYYIAITTDNPLSALLLFFVAVILVIIGTYFLFIAGSISILKALRKNKHFYYKPNHFTAVSGMIYRMKQNAVGLANICILSTMVLVMISTTVCLRVGIDDLIDNSCPGDISFSSSIDINGVDKTEEIYDVVINDAEKNKVKLDKVENYTNLSYTYGRVDNTYYVNTQSNESQEQLSFISATQYEKLTGRKVKLAENEVIAAGADIPNTFFIEDDEFTVKERVDKFLPNNDTNDGYYPTHYIVVANEDIFLDIGNTLKTEGGVEPQYYYQMEIYSSSPKANVGKMCDSLKSIQMDNVNYVRLTSKEEVEQDFYGFSGGFLFLGIFLGIVFTFAAALIIYYKQISEGYYDKEKFEIMQKVGMSKSEVKKSIKTQVLMVFFTPLAMAAIHILAAFNMIKELLKMFTLNNVSLFASCTAVTFVIFAIIYSIVYAVTAREYYKIVD